MKSYNIISLEIENKESLVVEATQGMIFTLETALTMISVEKLVDIKNVRLKQYFLIESENLEAFKKLWTSLPMSADDPYPVEVYVINKSDLKAVFPTVVGEVGKLLLIPEMIAAKALNAKPI